MRTIDTRLSIALEADRKVRSMVGRLKGRIKYAAKAHEYLSGTHRYKLIENQRDTGDITIMAGSQAKATNEVLLAKFREELALEIDAGVPYGKTTSNLRRWVILERNVQEPIEQAA